MNRPNSQYSWKCSPATAKWMTAVTAPAMARPTSTNRRVTVVPLSTPADPLTMSDTVGTGCDRTMSDR
jgi:hypothetical protein